MNLSFGIQYMADKHSRILRVYQTVNNAASEMLRGSCVTDSVDRRPQTYSEVAGASGPGVLKYLWKRSRAYTNSTEKFPGPDLLVSDVDAGPHHNSCRCTKVSDRAADSYAELIQSRPDTTAMNMDPRESITHFSGRLTTSNVPESTIYLKSPPVYKNADLKPEVMPSLICGAVEENQRNISLAFDAWKSTAENADSTNPIEQVQFALHRGPGRRD
jgi:hypothetical protein